MVTIYPPLSNKRKENKRYLTNEDLNTFLSDSGRIERIGGTGPLFSIVIPSYNQASFLEKTIKSILHQNYHNVEIIVIDGGSTDGTVSILKKYSSNLKYWESKKDNGQSDALNKGFSQATGEIYGWLNSDDLYLPGAIRSVAEIFNVNSSVDIVYGDMVTVNENDEILAYHHAIPYNKNHLLYEGFTMNAQAMFWRAALHKKFGLFNGNLHRTMDYDMMVRFSRLIPRKRFHRCDTFLAGFRRHSLQKTKGFDANVQSELKTIKKNAHISYKYSFLGTIIKLIFKIRRIYWNIHILGFSTASREFLKILKRKIKQDTNAI